MIAYLGGGAGGDVETLDRALADGVVKLPPVVLTEMLSDPKASGSLAGFLRELPLLAILDGYWDRAAELRRRVLASKRRARLADTLIAQSCLDHRATLITRDHDFLGFSSVSALKLVSAG